MAITALKGNGLESKFVVPMGKPVGEIATNFKDHEIQALDSDRKVICTTKYCTVTQSVQVYDAKGKLIFEATPGNGTINIKDETFTPAAAWANYLSFQANIIRSAMRTEPDMTKDLLGTYNSIYTVLMNAARGLNAGAYMREENRGE